MQQFLSQFFEQIRASAILVYSNLVRSVCFNIQKIQLFWEKLLHLVCLCCGFNWGFRYTVFVALEFGIYFLCLLDVQTVVKCVHVQTNPQHGWTHIRYGRYSFRLYLTIFENSFQAYLLERRA